MVPKPSKNNNLRVSAISAWMCLCQSNMKASSVIQFKNRAEKAVFVFVPFSRQDSSTKWLTVVLLCECACFLNTLCIHLTLHPWLQGSNTLWVLLFRRRRRKKKWRGIHTHNKTIHTYIHIYLCIYTHIYIHMSVCVYDCFVQPVSICLSPLIKMQTHPVLTINLDLPETLASGVLFRQG